MSCSVLGELSFFVHATVTPCPKISLKSYLWRLPYKRVVYYDLDIHVKQPVEQCAKKCPLTASLCAVRDSVATWPVKRKDYFNSGFMVLLPDPKIADRLDSLSDYTFGDQNKLNAVFKNTWTKLFPWAEQRRRTLYLTAFSFLALASRASWGSHLQTR